jgi:hypothetical protein
MTASLRLLALFAGTIVLSGAAPARAAIWRVPGNFASIANAIADSTMVAAGDTIRVVGNGGATFRERSVVTRPLRIEGGWRADFQVQDPSLYVTVIRDPADAFEQPLFRVVNAGNVVIDGFTLIGGRRGIEVTSTNLHVARCEIRGQRNLVSQSNPLLNVPGAGMRIVGGSVMLEKVTIRDTVSPFGGCGIGMVAGAQVRLIDCLIDNVFSFQPLVPGSGGGISAVNCGLLRLENTDIQRSVVINDAALVLARNTPFYASSGSFTQGSASVSAGALMLIDCPAVELVDCAVEDCTSNNKGGAMFIQNCGSLVMDGCTVQRNLGKLEGGGLYLEGTPFTMTDCHWEANGRDVFPIALVGKGGAVRAVNSSGSVTRTCFVGEIASAWGGAWSNAGGDIAFEDCVFDATRSKIFGGGFHAELSGGGTFTRCLFRGCQGLFGGALGASFTATLGLDRCTLVDNSGVNAGAGIYLDTNAEATVTSSILARAVHGDMVNCSAGTIAISYSNVWNDASNNRPEFGGTCPDPVGSNGNLSVDPQLCAVPGAPPFCDPSTTAFSLGPGSPCVGAGEGGVDMGWRGVGCTATPLPQLELESWGRLKSRYR